uniref:uncharacterized protein LOC122603068 n=1 Tax=Erigeron canadensis TaxID=72917 RepID=UPI001CB894B6|nr:uncharacterized protein LOC122603068 [Erigeron canadensis]
MSFQYRSSSILSTSISGIGGSPLHIQSSQKEDANSAKILTSELTTLDPIGDPNQDLVYMIFQLKEQDHGISSKEVPPRSYISRFAPPICDMEIPKCIQLFNLKLYDGTKGPKEHVARFRVKIERFPIPAHLREGYLCKGFKSTLMGSANLIKNLYKITQGPNKSLASYLNRFCQKCFPILDLEITLAVQAFHMGLRSDSPLYDDLSENPCRSLLEARIRGSRYADEEDRMRIKLQSAYDCPNRKLKAPSFISLRAKPYSRSDYHRIDNVDKDKENEEYPNINDYHFSVDISGLIFAMYKLGNKVRWPKAKNKNPKRSGKLDWCAFLKDFSDMTKDCLALRKEVGILVSKGYLDEILRRSKA